MYNIIKDEEKEFQFMSLKFPSVVKEVKPPKL